MADIEAYKNALIKADRKGDKKAAIFFANKIRELNQSQPQQPQEPQQQDEVVQNETTAADQVLGGISGAATLAGDVAGTAIGGLTALVDKINPLTDNDPEQLINSIKDKLRIEPTSGGQEALRQLGDALEPVAPIIKAVTDFADKGADQGLDITGSPAVATFIKLIPDLALEMTGFGTAKRVATSNANAPVTDLWKKTEQAGVESLDESTGITQLTSDAMPPQTRLGRLMQSQGELVAGFQRRGQQEQRVKAIEKLASNYDVIDGVGFEAKIVKGLKDSVKASKKAIGELYEQSTAKLDQMGSVPLSKTKEFAQGIIKREGQKGTKADQTIVNDMQNFVDAPDDLTFELIKEIRSSVGSNLAKVERGAPVQGNADTGLLKRVYAKITDDMVNFAKDADPQLAKKWKRANDTVSEFALGNNKQGAKAIIKRGDADPEIVDRLLFSNKNSDIEFLASNLDDAGKGAAKQRILQRALSKSSIDGDDINPNKFLKQLNDTRNQIGKLFNPEERKAIFALRDQLSKTRRAQDAPVTTPTGQQLTLGAALAVPAALIPGVLAGIAESKPIRNLIIKRRAAKTARQRIKITDDLRKEIDKLGLKGAATTSAATTVQEQD